MSEKQKPADEVTVHLSAEPVESKTIVNSPTLRVYQPLPEDHQFYHTIGRVVSEWAHFEHALDVIIWKLLSWGTTGLPDKLMASVTSQIMGVNPRCKVIEALGRAHKIDDAILKKVRRLKNDSFSVADWRNRWVHDPWYSDKDTDEPSQFRAMPPIDPQYGLCDIKEDEVERTISETRALKERTVKLLNKIQDALRSSKKQS